mgnify:CR=1 FL=1
MQLVKLGLDLLLGLWYLSFMGLSFIIIGEFGINKYSKEEKIR